MKNELRKPGLYISFCGIDGSGKTTQMFRLAEYLNRQGIRTIAYEEKNNFVQEISGALALVEGQSSGRSFLKENNYSLAMSFEILRREMTIVQPYLTSGLSVVSSRSVFDWLAGFRARGCNQQAYDLAKKIFLFSGQPDILFWLDCPPVIAKQRTLERGYDQSDQKYLKKYQQGFREVLKKYQHYRLDAAKKEEAVGKEVIKIVNKLLKQLG